MFFLSRTQSVNLCTTRYLASDNKNHLLCNVLKGGSTSWQRFLDQNKIPTSLLAECVSRDGHYTCPGQFHTRILQVRHPMERLLGTWRHVFKNGGWKLLELEVMSRPELYSQYEELYGNITWYQFIEEVVLGDKFSRTEAQLDQLNSPGVWVKLHWAPYWYTCGLCGDLTPDYILKTETLQGEVDYLLKLLKIPHKSLFPHSRISGPDDHSFDSAAYSHTVLDQYYSQLDKQQVIKLYNMYRLDFDMFGYQPHKYIDLAM